MSTKIKYNDSTISEIESGEKATLTCKDMKMLSNVVVEFDRAGAIEYDGVVTPVNANETATLTCGGMKSISDIVISIKAEVADDGTGLYDANGDIVATWGTLVNTYGMNVGKTYTTSSYQTDTESPYYVFTNNAELSGGVKLVIPNSVTSIGNYAFYKCSSLTSVTIPNSVTSIGEGAFEGCSSLTSVYITDIEAWCNISFSNSYSNPLRYAHNLYLNNKLVTDLVIPDSVTSIGGYAFYYCTRLTSITIPDSVVSIGTYAFWGCTYSTTVTIGNSVTSIGNLAFAYNYVLTTVTINAITPPTLEGEIFKGSDKLTAIYVPDSAYGAYTSPNATNWTNYAEKIKRLSEKE